MSKPKSMHGKDCDCEKCMASGGEVDYDQDPAATQSFQDSFRKSTHYADGGAVSDEGSAHFNEVKSSAAPQAAAPSGGKSGGLLSSILNKGGKVSGAPKEDDGDEEIHEGLGKELMESIHSKDHKKLMSGIEAMVLHHMNKRND